MRMDTPVILTMEKPGMGANTGKAIVAAELAAYCRLEEVGANTYWQASAAGTELQKTIIVWAWDVRAFTHAQIGGIKYRIHKVAKAKDRRQRKLHLTRG